MTRLYRMIAGIFILPERTLFLGVLLFYFLLYSFSLPILPHAPKNTGEDCIIGNRRTGDNLPNNMVQLFVIFNAFHQIDGSATRECGVIGAGLAIRKQISQLMGGDVWAESEPGKGSIFQFSTWFEGWGKYSGEIVLREPLLIAVRQT